MASNGSFYQNGLPLSTLETGLGNVPASVAPKPANSSFYLSGSVYNTLANQDALLALITADTSLVVADLVSANAAAAAAAASAAAAAASVVTLGTTALLKANNLSDLSNLTTALTNLGLQNVNNTSDVNKPVSTAQATADALVASNAATANALKANIASPAFTGIPTTAATPAALDNSLKLATTAYADAAVSTLSGTVNTALALKAPLASPALTGVPVAPTAAALNNTTQLATTAYADAAVAVEATAARNATNLTSGAVPAARMPAFTGDVTTVAGAVANTIAANAVTNAKMATMAASTVKANITAGVAVPTDNTLTATLDALISSTRGGILVRGVSAWAPVAIGTNTQVLTSNGTDPGWAAATGGGGTSVTISDTAPGSPSAGNLWWQSSTGNLYIYYTDINSSQWVAVLSGMPNTVLYDTVQTLTAGQQLQARQNIGAFTTAVGQFSTGSSSTTSTTGLMQGLGTTVKLTPNSSGRVHLVLSGSASVNFNTGGFNIEVRYGTGTAPTAGAAPAGSTITSTFAVQGWSAVSGAVVPFGFNGIITGLTPGTAYWFDVKLSTSTATATLNGGSWSLVEL